jgi:recombinational DNA repair ATPase RecF
VSNRLGLVVDQGARRLFVDGIERPLDMFLGRLDLVALPNEAMRILRDAPEGRRRFIDSGIVGLHPGSCVTLVPTAGYWRSATRF